MTDEINNWTNRIHQGDAFELIEEIPDDSIHCAVTSPPYWGLRDYDAENQMGLEDSVSEYIENLVKLGTELKRVIRDDGSWWLNLGDVFAQEETEIEGKSLSRKSKLLLPHRVAISLAENGWVVRSDVVWSKPNPMPHSTQDRLNEEKEFIFQLANSPDYWFDLDPIREAYSDSSIERIESEAPILNRATEEYADSTPISGGESYSREINPNGKNPGDVWELTVPTFSEAHFAVYPESLVERPIKTTCPPTVCASCGTPYERNEEGDEWQQVCSCCSEETESGIVLDPFIGSGTTATTAKRLGRDFIGFELNPDYVTIAQRRAGLTVSEPERLDNDDNVTRLNDFMEDN